MRIVDRLRDKRILIWGYGREGKSTELFIRRHCKVRRLEVFEGKEEELIATGFDYIIKSPGIPVKNYLPQFTSQTELFLEEFASQTVGITGTKGKSTTATMLYEALSACRGNTVLVGNVGLPCFDLYEEIDSDTVVVFEMSCHQLNHIRFSPHIAVFLNLYEDHLDYYGTRENYFEAKSGITAHQSAGDWLYRGPDVPPLKTAAQCRWIPTAGEPAFRLQIKGEHNQFNARFVFALCTEQFHCDPAAVTAAIERFHGLSHRLEFIGRVDGVDYYDDSISTIPEATIQAIQSVPNTASVIIGGMDRQIRYDALITFIQTNPQIRYIFCYASGKRIFDEVADLPYCCFVENLTDAVACAKRITPVGGACVLSPAAASYGYFRNFEERGRAFAELVHGGQTEERS